MAIEKANQRVAELEAAGVRAMFRVSDVCDLAIAGWCSPNVVVFNEVLYYLAPGQAASQVARILSSCPGARVVISMKDDVKSKRVFDELSSRVRWMNSILYQEKLADLSFVVRKNRERPAFLIAIGELK